jgi:Na+-transporting NADH:ubiquinone oxidoreductase subunit NqrD
MNEIFGKITSKDIRNIIAVMIVTGCFVMVYLFLAKEIPNANRDLVMVIAGAIVGNLKDVTSYFFGSSKNEADKAKKEAE